MLSFFLIFTNSVIVGLDFGNENIKISSVKFGEGVKIVLNEENKKSTKSYFAIWNESNPNQGEKNQHWSIADIRSCSWLFGIDAFNHYMKYPNHVFKGLNNISLSYNGLMNREAYAILLRHIFQTMDNGEHEPINVHVVFAVNPDMKRSERYMLNEIIKMTGGDLIGVVDAPTAVATLYAVERSLVFRNSPKRVVFIDIGADKTWMSIFLFNSTDKDSIKVDQMSLINSIPISGNIVDQRIGDFLLNKFIYENHVDEKDITEKIRMMFYQKAREVKESLTVNKNVEVKFDDIIGNTSFELLFQRNTLEFLISDFYQILEDSYLKLIDEAHIFREEIDNIELIGGSSRIPFFIESINEISGISNINRTLNSDEAIALGAGYFGIINSDISKNNNNDILISKKKVSIHSFCNTNIFLYNHIYSNFTQLFNSKSRLNDSNFYEFKSANNSNISLIEYDSLNDNDTLYRKENEIIKFNITLPPTAKNNVTVHLDFGFDEFTLPGVYNIKLNKIVTRDNINFFPPKWAMSKLEFNHSVAFIKRMDFIDSERKQTQYAFSNFESFLYNSKYRIENDEIIQKVTTEEERLSILKKIENDYNWLYSNNHKIPLNSRIINDRMSKINKTVSEVDLKAYELPRRKPAFEKLLKLIDTVCFSLNYTWPHERPWMPKKYIDDMKTSVDHAMKYYKIFQEQQRNKSDTETPGVLSHDIEMQIHYLEMVYNFTLKNTKTPPTPKPPKTPNPYVKTYSTYEEFEDDVEKQREKDLFGL